jgi:hypothetical protein
VLLWYHQESNRGHKDFQSFALPTELWYHRFSGHKSTIHFLNHQMNLSIIYLRLTFRFEDTKSFTTFVAVKKSGCSTVGSALRSGRRGRKFESSHPDKTTQTAFKKRSLGVILFGKTRIYTQGKYATGLVGHRQFAVPNALHRALEVMIQQIGRNDG